MPVGAYGGKREIMSRVAPSGPIYQAGTLSGNPLAVTAGIATLKELQKPGVYEELEAKSSRLDAGLRQAAAEAGLELAFNRVGSMLCTFFTPGPVTDFASACRADTEQFGTFFRAMLEAGVYLAPAQFEAAFMSLVHTGEQIEHTIEAARAAFKQVKN